MSTETKTNEVVKLKEFTNKVEVIAALKAVSNNALWVKGEHVNNDGEHSKQFMFVDEVENKLGDLVLDKTQRLVSFWLNGENKALKVGTIINAGMMELTLLSKIAFSAEHGQFYVVNRGITTVNYDGSSLDAECANDDSLTHKRTKAFGTQYCIEPDFETVNKFIKIVDGKPELQKSLKTACTVIGFNYDKLMGGDSGAYNM